MLRNLKSDGHQIAIVSNKADSMVQTLKNVYFDFSHFNELVNYIDFISLFDCYKGNRNNNA